MAHISSSAYASHTKELLGLVNQLHALGAQGDIDLPRIAVIGNQSAGKSSVVEAISGISVPRDAGTCTRCPMECRLASSSGPWQCRISIRREYDSSNRRLDEIKEVPFGDVITDKSHVEQALRGAQLSVLNPNIPIHKILAASSENFNEWTAQSAQNTPFSRNVVCVDLRGPELTDLSFIDLPGLIANAETNIVQLVEEMVVSHIRGNCLILVALPMTDDIENQKALKLAKTEDPQGRRTIGVMTKPDMLPEGSTKSLHNWLDVIEGRRHLLVHGYYCTRQPDDLARSQKITVSTAREKEVEFFSKTEPWSKSTHRDRFGTENLIVSLSRLLVRIIQETLPKMRTDAMHSLESCRAELSRIPPAVNEAPATHVLKLITQFSTEIRSLIKGRSDASTLIQENRAAFKAFKIAIRATAPNFVPVKKLEIVSQSEPLYGVEEDVEEDVEYAPERPTSRFDLIDMRRYINQSITRELPNNVPFDAKVALIVKFQETWPAAVLSCFERVESTLAKHLSKTVEVNFSRYLILHGQMKTFLIELMSKHKAACQSMLKETLESELTPFTQNTHYLETSTEGWLAKYKDIRAGKKALPVEPPTKRQRTTDAPLRSQDVFISGTGAANEPFVFNSAEDTNSFAAHGMQAGAHPFLFGRSSSGANGRPIAPLPRQMTPQPQPMTSVGGPTVGAPTDPEMMREALAMLARVGYNVTEEELGKLNPPDEFEGELKVMAEVRGYFQVAYKRVIDMIPQFIDSIFLRGAARELQSFLIEKFGLGTAAASEKCARYLEEDAHLVARRDELSARERRLMSVQQQLINFGIGSDDN